MYIVKGSYTDLPVFIEPNPFDGDITVKRDQNAIQQSLKNIILTFNGERPFEYYFGTRITSSLFENPDSDEFNLGITVTDAIIRYETRIRNVELDYNYTNKTLEIDLSYSIPKTEVTNKLRMTLERTR